MSLMLHNCFGLVKVDPREIIVTVSAITDKGVGISRGYGLETERDLLPEGSSITLRVEGTGLDPLSYEWRFNGEILEGITGNSYTIDEAAVSDQGEYVVTVSDACGSITTAPAILTVLVPPTIVEHPQSQTVRVGDTVTFSVTVTKTATLPVWYRWRHGSNTLTNQPLNAHTSTYTINNVQLGDAGDYRVVVTNAANCLRVFLTDPATLTVEP